MFIVSGRLRCGEVLLRLILVFEVDRISMNLIACFCSVAPSVTTMSTNRFLLPLIVVGLSRIDQCRSLNIGDNLKH